MRWYEARGFAGKMILETRHLASMRQQPPFQLNILYGVGQLEIIGGMEHHRHQCPLEVALCSVVFILPILPTCDIPMTRQIP